MLEIVRKIHSPSTNWKIKMQLTRQPTIHFETRKSILYISNIPFDFVTFNPSFKVIENAETFLSFYAHHNQPIASKTVAMFLIQKLYSGTKCTYISRIMLSVKVQLNDLKALDDRFFSQSDIPFDAFKIFVRAQNWLA